MNIVPIQITGRTAPATDERSWTRTRVEAAALEAVARGVASGATANITATLAVSLWANETGWGRSERRFNVGSVHCAANFNGDCMRVGSELLRAYPRLDVAISEWFGLVQSEYPEAWTQLLAGNLGYWDTLQRGGYGGHVTAREALSIYRRVCTNVGFAGMDGAEESAFLASWSGSSRGSSSSSSSSSKPLLWVGVVWGVGKLGGWW